MKHNNKIKNNRFKNLYKNIKIYIIKTYNKIKPYLKNNHDLIYLFLSMFILDFALRVFYYKSINFYGWYRLIPNLFTTVWIFLILGLAKTFKNIIGKTIYIISYIISLALFLTHSIYFSYFNIYFDFSTLRMAGEGTEYFSSVLTNVKWWVIVTVAISLILSFKGIKKLNNKGKFKFKNLFIVLISFLLVRFSLPFFLGNPSTSVEWDDWRNPRSIYKSFNDNNKSMMISGMYEYTIRNIYVNFIKDESKITEEEQEALNNNFKNTTTAEENNYTGAFKGKNLIIVQLESIDDFLVTKKTMPTLYSMMNNSINFTKHYSFTSGGGSTFNSEFMVNTGYSTAYNYNEGAYFFSRNNYAYSLPNLLKNLGYTANAFHMNTKEFYSRGVNYKSFGYDNYFGLKDQGTYTDNSYWLDTELIKNETFNENIFNNDGLSLSYIITYSAHMPFSSSKGTCSLLTEKENLSEYECLKIQAKETDDFMKLLLENLEAHDMLDNTVIAVFSDHYLYTLEDKSLLDKNKTTSNNLINHTPFFIWSNGQIKETIKDVNSQLDILPTLLNLFGIEYFPNYYLGIDILDDSFNPIVYFSDGSWYNGSTYIANGEYQSGKKISTKKINSTNNLVKNKMTLNDAVLKSDYFQTIVDEKLAEEKRKLEEQKKSEEQQEIEQTKETN